MSKIQFEDCGVLVEYFYLDSEERRRFAQVGHEYLIEQVQFPGQSNLNSVGTSSTFNSQKFKMDFNHPCKEVVFALKSGAFSGQALKSSLLGNRGRFLTYTNKSDENSWDSAVDYAARNLANGMVALGNSAPTVGNWTRLVLEGNIAIGSTGSVTVTNGDGTTFNFIISNNDNTTAIQAAVAQPIWYHSDSSLVKNGQNLGASILEVTVALTVDNVRANGVQYQISSINNQLGGTVGAGGNLAFGATTCVPSACLVVSNHNLNLTDVSIPVEDFDTDNRVTVNTVNPWDVTVVQPSNYGLRLDGAGNPVSTGNITLNGHDRFSVEDGDYFNYYQPLQHHTRTPADGVNVYSFALHPEQHQPSGTCNMSRIDSAYLVLKFMDRLRANSTIQLDYTTDSVFYIFALNYNVLRIMSGMGGFLPALLPFINNVGFRSEKLHAITKMSNGYWQFVLILIKISVASRIEILQDILLIGKPVKLNLLKRILKSIFWLRNKNLGIVKMIKIYDENHINRQPACLDPKSAMLAYGSAPETERISVGDEGLNNLSQLKIQSIPLGKLRGNRELTATKQFYYIFLFLFVVLQTPFTNKTNLNDLNYK